jgi:succinate dehydrogenase / fumarate reductase cytochrome b subunit
MEKNISPTYTRPLSPHLQIYRPQITSMLSILHRITGAALCVGTVLLVSWLWSAAYSPHCFAVIHTFMLSVIGKLLLFGWTFAFYYHFCNGIRHLFWDIGKGFEIETAARTGWLVIIASLGFTIVTWMIIIAQSGTAPGVVQ